MESCPGQITTSPNSKELQSSYSPIITLGLPSSKTIKNESPISTSPFLLPVSIGLFNISTPRLLFIY